MNKIVPFKKEIEFESIYQITSISLEHTLSLKEDNIVKGNFIVSGSYKRTESSINLDEFNFELPFEISIDNKYETKDITVDINDFYYEIIDNEILSLNIEIIIDNLSEKEDAVEKNEREIININKEEVDEKINKEETQDREIIEETDKNIESIFDGLDCNENYITYKVHVMTENDTIESITREYNIKKRALEDYNNLTEIKIGDKIIIPLND